MARTDVKYPSDLADCFNVRMPDGLRDLIRAAAQANGRSMNAEIVSRLSGDVETLRDKFAGQAAQGAVAGHFSHYGHDNYWAPFGIADYAYEVADAMLAARKGGA